MIIIHFPDQATECTGLGFLARRFSFKTWCDGRTAVPEAALSALALEGIPFSVEGPATYEKLISTVRDSSAPAI